MDPVRVAFSLSEPVRYQKVTGRCARCGSPGRLTPTRQVLSPTFTGFDGWIGPAGGLCPSCTWLYQTPALRNVPHLVTQAPTFNAIDLTEAYVLLAQGPLKPTCALSVPLRPGRKHLFADVQWGTIRTDDTNLTWTAADADRLTTLRHLRELGFSPAQIADPAPRFEVLQSHPSSIWAATTRSWATLECWRRTRHWLALALTLTKGIR